MSEVSSSTGIDALPVELLHKIFIMSVLKGHWLKPHPMDPLPKFDTSALRVAAVCESWRAIALSLPELWTTMAVYDPSSKAVDLVRLYLSRAGEEALFSLYLTQYQGPSFSKGIRTVEDNVEESKNTRTIIELWTSHIERWQSIYFEFHNDMPPSGLTRASPGQLKSLRDVGLNASPKHFNRAEFHRLWDALHSAPNLRSTFWSPRPELDTYLASAPLKQLTSLTLHLLFLSEIYLILRTASQLEHLTSEATLHDLDDSSQPGPILVPNLQTLHFRGEYFEVLPPLLDCLVAPSLSSLALGPLNPRLQLNKLPVNILKGFLARSKCTLRALLLQGNLSQEAFVSGILRAADQGKNGVGYLHGLEKLTCGCAFDWSILKPSRNPVTGVVRVPFPSLLTLEALVDQRDGIVGQVLLAREQACAGLWSVKLGGSYYNGECTLYDLHPKNTGIFKGLEKRGLRLQR